MIQSLYQPILKGFFIMDRVTYHDQTDMQNVLKLREVLRTLPEFCRDYFRAIDATTML